MKVTYNWLKDFVNIKLSPEALADKLTMAGLEVTSLEKLDGDAVFEIEITSNRPDWLSVAGIAREVAAITSSKLQAQSSKLPPQTQKLKKANDSLEIVVEDKKDCPLYTAKIIRDVKVGPSPHWLKSRLESIGCRSINNIVDIANYVLFTWGEPLHAFDLDKLATPSEITVKRARKAEEITSIDGVKRTLNEEILIIASGKPVAIAGVMGGKDTEVTDRTKNVLLEAAVFNPVIIRRGRQRLGLQTDSSYRFERGIAGGTAEFASWQAVRLIQLLAKGSLTAEKSAGSSKTKSRAISLSVSGVQKILNINIPVPKIKSILNSLGFTVKTKSKNNLTVIVPDHRPDVNLEIDLIEEIARIFGFQKIPRSLPPVNPQLCIREERDLVALTKNILVGLGLQEVITYSLIDKDGLDTPNFRQEQAAIEILNPLSQEQEILRPTLLPGLTRCVAYNLNQKQEYVSIFEIAKAFSRDGGLLREELMLAVGLCGSRSFWLEEGMVKDTAGFLHLKGILEALCKKLGITDYDLRSSEASSGADIHAAGEKIGLMLALEKSALDKFDIKNRDVFLMELSLEKLLSLSLLQKKYAPLPKYPGIARDISFILKEETAVKDLLEALLTQGRPLLSSIKIVDSYKGKQIPEGYRGLTISCLYRSDEKTLTETEISPLHAALCKVLSERFAAKIR